MTVNAADERAAGGAPQGTGDAPAINTRALAAFVITTLVVIAVLAMLPAALASMVKEMRGQETDQIYDLFTGAETDPDEPISPDTAFVNITAMSLDEGRRMAMLTVSGHRVCPAICPEITGTFYSLGNDAARRRGLPPSATVTVPGKSGSYTYSMELPIHGTPQRYPFDDYTLLLGLIVSHTLPNGNKMVIDSPEQVRRNVSMTLEDQAARLNMLPPVPVDPVSVRSPSDPTAFMLVDQLTWQRPVYLRIVTILLVVLISASGIFALGLRSLHELVLGIGGIILGIWGVRSVVVQSPLPDVTLIDLILAFVMLVLLLALATRAARYFLKQSGLGRRVVGGG